MTPRRVLWSAWVETDEYGGCACIEVTADVDTDEDVPLRDAVVFVEPTIDELERWYGLHESAIDRLREHADLVAARHEAAARDSTELARGFLTAARDAAAIEREAARMAACDDRGAVADLGLQATACALASCATADNDDGRGR